ncbi:MAG: BolA family protein [Methyloligellaceae bacterium]
MTAGRCKRIEVLLQDKLSPTSVLVKDQSHLHVGHPGAREGKGHFDVHIVSEAFAGKSRIERHRLVFDAVDEMMKSDIHALKIRATTPGET